MLSLCLEIHHIPHFLEFMYTSWKKTLAVCWNVDSTAVCERIADKVMRALRSEEMNVEKISEKNVYLEKVIDKLVLEKWLYDCISTDSKNTWKCAVRCDGQDMF